MNTDKVSSYVNMDLINKSEDDFKEMLSVDFIDDDFIAQVEWAMLLVQQKMKQMFHSKASEEVQMSTFDKSYLIAGGKDSLDNNIQFLKGLDEFQVTPNIFPNLNIKYMVISDSVGLHKIKELDIRTKSSLRVKKRYAYEFTESFYNKQTECFYGNRSGYAVNDNFFTFCNDQSTSEINDVIDPISLKNGYSIAAPITYYDTDVIADIFRHLLFSYQIAMTMYYEWCIYIKEKDSIGLIIPINPLILSEIYKTSMLKFDSRKRMLHFVREHYRRIPKKTDVDYSIFIQKYLRGEHKFDYRGFYTEIIPPKYDLNRVKTRKKFVDANS